MKKTSNLENIFAIGFIVWFIISIVSMIIASEVNAEHLVLFICGQYFIVFGLIALYKKAWFAIAHYLVGIGLMISSPIAHNYDRLSVLITDLSSKQKLFILGTILVFIIGIVFLILHLINKKHNKYFWIFLVFNTIFIISVFMMSL